MTDGRPWRADGTRHDQLLLMRNVPKVVHDALNDMSD
jgi:hypothetical protein